MNRRTKIVATIGPSCNSPKKLQELMDAGDNIFRLNFSHGTQEEKGGRSPTPSATLDLMNA
jgi:pyruvate kinase